MSKTNKSINHTRKEQRKHTNSDKTEGVEIRTDQKVIETRKCHERTQTRITEDRQKALRKSSRLSSEKLARKEVHKHRKVLSSKSARRAETENCLSTKLPPGSTPRTKNCKHTPGSWLDSCMSTSFSYKRGNKQNTASTIRPIESKSVTKNKHQNKIWKVRLKTNTSKRNKLMTAISGTEPNTDSSGREIQKAKPVKDRKNSEDKILSSAKVNKSPSIPLSQNSNESSKPAGLSMGKHQEKKESSDTDTEDRENRSRKEERLSKLR